MTVIPGKDFPLCARNAGHIYGALLGLLVFQNLFNAFSPYLTLAVNITVVILLLTQHSTRGIVSAWVVIIGVYAVFGWMLLVTVYRGEAETQILLKYFRVTATVSLLALIFGVSQFPASAVVKAINVALIFHVLLIIFQIVFPDISKLSAPVFGFEREITVLEEATMRKLGASSSFDTASLVSVAALLFFYLQFTQGKGSRFLLMTTVAFAASLLSSRTGIALSLLVVMAILMRAILRADSVMKKLVIFLLFGGLILSTYFQIYPLLLHTLGTAELESDDVFLVFAAADYGTTGTFDALTGDHLKPLDQTLPDLLIGHALDPNSIGAYTDIGYVKLIYQIGIIGTLVILLVHLYMLVLTLMFLRASTHDPDRALIAQFLFLLIAITLAFNYKSLEIHSRGIGDFIYMLFLFLASHRRTL